MKAQPFNLRPGHFITTLVELNFRELLRFLYTSEVYEIVMFEVV